MPNVSVKVVTLDHFQGELPKYQTSGSSGMDVCAAISVPMTVEPMKRALVPTGLVVEIPQGFEIQVRPRSGLAFKQGLTVLNTPGTIDSDYRGEVKILLINLGDQPVTIQPQDRIAQLVVMPVVQAEIVNTTVASQTARGAGGFGSTGLSATT